MILLDINYETRVIEWYDRALKEQDETLRFVLLFITFEASIKQKYSKLRCVKTDNHVKEIFFCKVNNNSLEKLKNELDDQPLKTMNSENDILLKSKNDFCNIVEFVIKARNNLFHGDKTSSVARDQRIIDFGNQMLEPLVKAIIICHGNTSRQTN